MDRAAMRAYDEACVYIRMRTEGACSVPSNPQLLGDLVFPLQAANDREALHAGVVFDMPHKFGRIQFAKFLARFRLFSQCDFFWHLHPPKMEQALQRALSVTVPIYLIHGHTRRSACLQLRRRLADLVSRSSISCALLGIPSRQYGALLVASHSARFYEQIACDYAAFVFLD